MKKPAFKNKVNRILHDATKGIFSDQYWSGVSGAINQLNGTPVSKEWRIQVIHEGIILSAIITAHGAGSVNDPLDRYDISAYVTC
jgi:hypothetical protein